MNIVEVRLSLIERQAIHRGSFGSIRDLNARIRAFITGGSDRRHPLIWTWTVEPILRNASRRKTSNAGHWLPRVWVAE